MQPSLTEFLFSFNGRVSRRDFWIRWALPYFVVTVVLYLILIAIFPPVTAMVIHSLYLLVALWPSLAVYVKRAHDRGRSGWFVLLFLVPILNIWPLVELLFLPGTGSANSYGSAR